MSNKTQKREKDKFSDITSMRDQEALVSIGNILRNRQILKKRWIVDIVSVCSNILDVEKVTQNEETKKQATKGKSSSSMLKMMFKKNK